MDPVLTVVAGVTVLTVVGIAFGGTFMLRIVTGSRGANALQKTMFRAGHAHAGVLVTLGLVVALLTQAAGVAATWSAVGSILVLSAAILVPAGFFLSVLGEDPQRPNAWIRSVWAGFAVLVAGLVVAGVATTVAGVSALG
ncbi:hypothetical protein [Rhodococcus tukisamuensis]|uniref:Integral membrane protein n=1 Tax=Rhodococcus tukisamuensis TaxID=168276 RepID=A0A1G6W9Q6_9NOCA|nr:hypothetical protein [Rhodococcus tukisamuensis]SDD62561.1 hypothetical protein SAMN05444580_105296 [Rhodococcus tukisamuensis]